MCLQLNYTEKGVRKLIELLKLYQVALFDDEVLDSFKVMTHLPTLYFSLFKAMIHMPSAESC